MREQKRTQVVGKKRVTEKGLQCFAEIVVDSATKKRFSVLVEVQGHGKRSVFSFNSFFNLEKSVFEKQCVRSH